MIEVENLRKSYGPIEALRGISFKVKQSEVVGFLGPNGAGKTTTMRILTGYIHQTSGTASIAGHCVMSDTLAAQKRVGYLPESAPLYDDMYVCEYLDFVCDLRGLQGSHRKQRIEKVLESCDITSVARRRIGHLSKGFRQRVGLAQAFVHDPDIIILDEPTSGLDPNQIEDICAMIRNLGEQKTVIFSSHILAEVEATCSRVLILHKGELVADQKLGKGTGRRVVAGLQGKKSSVLKALSAMNGAAKVEALGKQRYAVAGKDPDKLPARIYQIAKDKEWALTELHIEQPSLADTFRQLTRNATASKAAQ